VGISSGQRALAAGALCALFALPARAAPDLPGAGRALVATPFQVSGDVVGGIGLLAAGLVATVGDAVSLVDANPLTQPVLRGAVSGAVQRIAFATGWVGSRSMEALRQEDIERLPQLLPAYGGAPFRGRLSQVGDGLGAFRLAIHDVLAGPTLTLLRAAGARGWSENLARRRQEARITRLGPDPYDQIPR
jgi:hypothetical protein